MYFFFCNYFCLSVIGLEYIVPKLKENGITTPKKLAQLTLRDMYEVGVEDAEDRRKLFYLIQRLQAVCINQFCTMIRFHVGSCGCCQSIL
jgi:hypothetical protein